MIFSLSTSHQLPQLIVASFGGCYLVKKCAEAAFRKNVSWGYGARSWACQNWYSSTLPHISINAIRVLLVTGTPPWCSWLHVQQNIEIVVCTIIIIILLNSTIVTMSMRYILWHDVDAQFLAFVNLFLYSFSQWTVPNWLCVCTNRIT